MKPTNYKQHKRHTFDSFSKKTLRHEARDYFREIKRRREREVSLSEPSIGQLSTVDKYFATEQVFSVLGFDVIVTNELIAEALQSLPEHKRDIILLFYFLDITDQEIGNKLNLLRSTVQYQRTSTLKQLRNFLEGLNDEEKK